LEEKTNRKGAVRQLEGTEYQQERRRLQRSSLNRTLLSISRKGQNSSRKGTEKIAWRINTQTGQSHRSSQQERTEQQLERSSIAYIQYAGKYSTVSGKAQKKKLGGKCTNRKGAEHISSKEQNINRKAAIKL
jgi:hypothetical protein